MFYEPAVFPELNLLEKPVTNAPQIRKTKNMKPSKAMIADAAIDGLLSGSLAVQSYARSVQSKAGTSARTLAEDQKERHSCGSCHGRAAGPTDRPS